MYILKVLLLLIGLGSTQLWANYNYWDVGMGAWRALIDGNLEKFLLYAQEYTLMLHYLFLPILTLLVFILFFMKKLPYLTILFLLKMIAITMILELAFNFSIFHLIIMILFSLFFLGTVDNLFEEKMSLDFYTKEELPPKDLESPIYYIFKKSTKERIDTRKNKIKILFFILTIFMFINPIRYFIGFIPIVLTIPKVREMRKWEFYGADIEITISSKVLRWDVPPFEESFQIDISNIKYFEIIPILGEEDNFYSLVTKDEYDIRGINTVDISKFREALMKVGVPTKYKFI